MDNVISELEHCLVRLKIARDNLDLDVIEAEQQLGSIISDLDSLLMNLKGE